MDTKRSAVVSATWRPFYDATGIPAAIRIGDQIHLSGHTGEDDAEGHFSPDLETQLRATFRNIAETLSECGSSWADVVSMTSYHVGLRRGEGVILRVAQEYLVSMPAWTAVGVTELWPPDALIEISCVAVPATA